jgi:hypothetical protein
MAIDRRRVGLNTHLPSAAQLDRVAAAGCQWIRIDVNMDQICPEPHVWVWDVVDRVVKDATARQCQIYATLAHQPAWVTRGSGPPEAAFDPWIVFVQAVAERYHGRIRYYGIDNEPNAYLTPGQYVTSMLTPAAQVLRGVDPDLKICGPELMTEKTDQGSWEKWLEDFAGLVDKTLLDIVTVHSYQKNGREVWRRVVGPQTWLMWLKGQQPISEVLRSCGLGWKPVWLTETGWPTDDVSEAEQASYYDQLLESLPNPVAVEKVFGYQAVDEAARDGNPPVRGGIMHEDLTPKPAYHVVQRYLQPGAV